MKEIKRSTGKLIAGVCMTAIGTLFLLAGQNIYGLLALVFAYATMTDAQLTQHIEQHKEYEKV